MENLFNYTQEELQKMLEKAQKELKEKLDKMTPEERAAAEAKAQKAIEEDQTKMQDLLESGSQIASGIVTGEKSVPKFCPNCGAKTEGGKFCSYCGNQL